MLFQFIWQGGELSDEARLWGFFSRSWNLEKLAALHKTIASLNVRRIFMCF